MKNIIISTKVFDEPEFEFVERKGVGHPDSLSDGLAEYLSSQYSQYTLKKFGAILHHNFDKVGLLGGASSVFFGGGELTSPIRVLLNGRAAYRFGKQNIDLKTLLETWTKEFMVSRLPLLNPKTNLCLHFNIVSNSSPGRPGNVSESSEERIDKRYWFAPRNLEDVPELTTLLSNDTSLGVGYFPLHRLELLALEVEKKLNSQKMHEKYPWLGSDIKFMGFRYRDEVDFTVCVPQISRFVSDINEYLENVECVKRIIKKLQAIKLFKRCDFTINNRDNYQTKEVYLTAIGTALESGDEGLVGRGNRVNGVISPMQPMSMEGACGKNPVYYIGKLYYVAANEISKKIFLKFNIPNQVFLVSQVGRELLDPWITVISMPPGFTKIKKLKEFTLKEISNMDKLTIRIINGEFPLY